jgi:hypothetical protein
MEVYINLEYKKWVLIIILVLILGLSCSSGKKEPFEKKFNLKRFKLRHFDLYNPLLHTFKVDPVARKEHPAYYRFDVYFDENDIVRYSFYRADSYGYLQKFIYNDAGNVKWVKNFPILVDSIDEGAKISFNGYYYIDGKLKVFSDEMNDELIIIKGDSCMRYLGVINGTPPFQIEKINPKDFFVHALH